jgi:hypothetical protein
MLRCPAIMALANLVVQILLLAVVSWYTVETFRLRKASQEQVEGVQKPCIGLLTEARNYEEAVLEMGGAVGGMVVAARDGNIVAHNTGSGAALNIRYQVEYLNPPEGTTVLYGPEGYMPIIPAGGTFVMQIGRVLLRTLEVELLFAYQSLTGQWYESRITIRELVLTDVGFRRMSNGIRAER